MFWGKRPFSDQMVMTMNKLFSEKIKLLILNVLVAALILFFVSFFIINLKTILFIATLILETVFAAILVFFAIFMLFEIWSRLDLGE